MRRALFLALAVTVLLGISRAHPAQAPAGLKPVVTISFAGYDEALGDVEFVGKLAGNPGLAKQLETKLKTLVGDGWLDALDGKRPWGLAVLTDGQQEFPTYAFLPVTDLKKLLKTINVVSKDLGDGVFELHVFGPDLYVTQKKGWAFVSEQRETLAKLPDDPVALLGGLEKKYDLAMRVWLKNVPQMFRRMFVSQLPMRTRHGMKQGFTESDQHYQLRVNLVKILLRQLATVVKEVDEFSVGLVIDRNKGTSFVELEVTARAGTRTAARLSKLGPTKTAFAGFDMPGASITGNFAGTLTDQQVKDTKRTIARIRDKARRNLRNEKLSANELKPVAQLLDDLLEVVDKTVDGKSVEGGITALLNPGAVTVVAGCAVADGNQVERIFKQLAVLAQKEDPEYGKMLKMNVQSYRGVRFHMISVPTEQYDTSEKLLAELFGERLDVTLGIGPRSAYLGVGPGGIAVLRQVIARSKVEADKIVSCPRISLSAARIAKFAAYMSVDDRTEQMANIMAVLFGQSRGKDRVTLTCERMAQGARFRLEIEQGLLRGVGMFSQMLLAGVPIPRPVRGGGFF